MTQLMLTPAREYHWGVVGRPDEIAKTVFWMVKTGYLTNKVVSVDGGVLPQ